MSLQKKSIQGVLWSTIRSWGGQFISTVILLLLARLLQPEAFGLVALATVYLAFTEVFVDQGFAQAIVQRRNLDDAHLDSAFWASLGAGVLLCGISIAIAPMLARFFGEPALAPIVSWMSLSFVILPFSAVQQAIFQRRMEFKTLAARTLVAQGVAGLVALGMAFNGFGVWSLVGQRLAFSVMSAVVLWKNSYWKPAFRFSRQHFNELFAFGVNMMGLRILNFVNTRSDDLLIGKFIGPEALGYYTVAYRLLRVSVDLLSSMLNQVALPAFAKIQGDMDRVRRAFHSVTQVSTLLAPPFFLGMSALAPDIVVLAFGANWAQSAPVMQILAFIGIIHATFSLNGTVLVALGKPSWKLGLTTLNAAANFSAFFLVVVVLKGGIADVALAFVLRGYLLLPLPLLLLRRLIQLDLATYVRQWLVPFLGALAMAGLLVWMDGAIGERLTILASVLVRVLAGAAFYAGLILLLEPERIQQVFAWARLVLPARPVHVEQK